MHDVYTVYTQESPSRPGLGVGLAMASLAVVLALGLALGRYKEGRSAFTLGDRVSPAGWPVSIRIPEQLRPYHPTFHQRQNDDLAYSDGPDLRTNTALFIGRRHLGRVRPPTWIALQKPLAIFDIITSAGISPAEAPAARPFGPLPGAEVRYRVGPETFLARLGVCANGTVVCAVLKAGGGSLRRASRMLDEVVASVELTESAVPAAPVPFKLPDGARLATAATDSNESRPRWEVFSGIDQPFWHADVYEVHLVNGRAPADVLMDTARVHLKIARLPEQPRESTGPSPSWQMPGPARLEEGVRYEYRLRELSPGRAVVAVGTSLAANESEMERAVGAIVDSYQSPTTAADAADAALSIVDALPADLERRRAETTPERWFLIYVDGTLEGFQRSTVIVDDDMLRFRDGYTRHGSASTLVGEYDAAVAADLRSFEIENTTRITYADGTSEVLTWQERCPAGGDVSRLVIRGPSRIPGTFEPSETFVPEPAMEAALLRVAKQGKPACLLTTNANLTAGPIGVWIEPIDPSTLEFKHLPPDELPPDVRYAVRVDEDCRSDSDIVAFDDDGKFVARSYGDSLLLVEGSADIARAAFRDSPQFMAVPGRP